MQWHKDFRERKPAPSNSTRSPLGRVGKAEELTAALLLLAGDAGGYITGQTLVVDGGLTLA